MNNNKNNKTTMKRILTIISDTALMFAMLLSAQQIMNLPLSWKCVWYMVLFSAALQIWTNKNK